MFFQSKIQGPVDQHVTLLLPRLSLIGRSNKMQVSDWLKKLNTQYNAQSGKFLRLTCKWVGEPGYVQPYKDKSIDLLDS